MEEDSQASSLGIWTFNNATIKREARIEQKDMFSLGHVEFSVSVRHLSGDVR